MERAPHSATAAGSRQGRGTSPCRVLGHDRRLGLGTAAGVRVERGEAPGAGYEGCRFMGQLFRQASAASAASGRARRIRPSPAESHGRKWSRKWGRGPGLSGLREIALLCTLRHSGRRPRRQDQPPEDRGAEEAVGGRSRRTLVGAARSCKGLQGAARCCKVLQGTARNCRMKGGSGGRRL